MRLSTERLEKTLRKIVRFYLDLTKLLLGYSSRVGHPWLAQPDLPGSSLILEADPTRFVEKAERVLIAEHLWPDPLRDALCSLMLRAGLIFPSIFHSFFSEKILWNSD